MVERVVVRHRAVTCLFCLFIISTLLCSTSFISIKFSQKNISRYNFQFLQSQLYDSLKHSPRTRDTEMSSGNLKISPKYSNSEGRSLEL